MATFWAVLSNGAIDHFTGMMWARVQNVTCVEAGIQELDLPGLRLVVERVGVQPLPDPCRAGTLDPALERDVRILGEPRVERAVVAAVAGAVLDQVPAHL